MKRPPTEAALATTPPLLFRYSSQKFCQRPAPGELGGRLRLITVASQLDAQRLALPAYLPTPTLGMLFFPGREDIVIGGAHVHVVGASNYQGRCSPLICRARGRVFR